MQYPVTLYRSTGGEVATQQAYSLLVKIAALLDGWHETEESARAADPAPTEPKPAPEDDDLVPTRAELEQKAIELGIRFDGRTADRTIAAKISEVLAETC